MFLSVMTKIPGRKNDGLLVTHGFRGFPSFAALSTAGKVLVRPRGRSLVVFEAAMEKAAGLDKDARKVAGRQLDTDKIIADFFRRVMLEKLGKPATERAVYRSVRAAMSEKQRRSAERALALQDLRSAQTRADAAKLGSRAGERAILDLLAAKQKLGDWPLSRASNRALLTLMRWAELRMDPLLFERFYADFAKVRPAAFPDRRDNDEFIARWKKRLEACWSSK